MERADIEALIGLEITKVRARLEALDWEDAEGTKPIFRHPDIKFEQLAVIELKTMDDRYFKLQTEQDDDGWGLTVREVKVSFLDNYAGDSPIEDCKAKVSDHISTFTHEPIFIVLRVPFGTRYIV